MAIAIGTITTGGASFSHNANGAQLLVVCVSSRSNPSGITVQFNGASMTKVASGWENNYSAGSSIFYLYSPDQGNYSISISGASTGCGAVAINITGARNTVGNTGNGTGYRSTTCSASTTCSSGSILFSAFCSYISTDATLGANQQSILNMTDGVYNMRGRACYKTIPSDGSYSMSYTSQGSAPDSWYGSAASNLEIVVAPAVGPANLKSLNTNLKANIKSYNTNLIANVKSINTNA